MVNRHYQTLVVTGLFALLVLVLLPAGSGRGWAETATPAVGTPVPAPAQLRSETPGQAPPGKKRVTRTRSRTKQSASHPTTRPRRSVKKKSPEPQLSLPGVRNRDPFASNEFATEDLLNLAAGFNDRQGLVADSARNPSGSPFTYRYQKDNMAVRAGFLWVSDLADSHPSSRPLAEASLPPAADQVSGLNFNLGASYRAFSLTGGYTRAFDRYIPAPQSPDEGQSEPGAWNSELAYTTELLRKETVLAVGYRKSSEALQSFLPEQRYSTKASMSLFEGTTLSLEYYLDKESAPDQRSGAEEAGYGITTRIGFGL